MDEFAVDGAVPFFVNYVEGIYVGYKFYETAAAEGLIDCDGPASINNNFTGKGSIGFPAAVMIAATGMWIWPMTSASASARWPTRWACPAGTLPL